MHAMQSEIAGRVLLRVPVLRLRGLGPSLVHHHSQPLLVASV